MALKKSAFDTVAELRCALRWDRCESVQDHVLSLLFIKYMRYKLGGQPFERIKIPECANFPAMGKSDIAD